MLYIQYITYVYDYLYIYIYIPFFGSRISSTYILICIFSFFLHLYIVVNSPCIDAQCTTLLYFVHCGVQGQGSLINLHLLLLPSGARIHTTCAET